jgi:hypothetical protein
MSLTKFIVGFFVILFCASVGVCVAALKITSKPRQYISLAKLVSAPTMATSATNPKALEDFHGAIIETIESAEMRRRSLDRVRALYPDLKGSDVQIEVSQTRGSSIFNVRAFGTDPKYTKTYLDALLDEFIDFRVSSSGENVTIMERASGAVEDLPDWLPTILIGGTAGAACGALIAFLTSSLFSRSSAAPGERPGRSFGP